MGDYDLSRLSSRSFEQLIQALAAKILGPGLVVFGDGPDGGREATFTGRVPFPTEDRPWDGYGVVQAKYRRRPGHTQSDGKWALQQLKQELSTYTNTPTNRRLPEYFIYATNVVLTPVQGKGSKDQAVSILEEFKSHSPLKDFVIWDYDQIGVYLDAYEDVRRAYSFFLTPSDILQEVVSRLKPRVEDMHQVLTTYLEKELLGDHYVNLEQAGHAVDERIPLATVFVDLPTHHEAETGTTNGTDTSSTDMTLLDTPTTPLQGFVKTILTTCSEKLDPASLGGPVVSEHLDSRVPPASRGRFVLIGGPGQGKTTLTQFICQIFRAAIIKRKAPHRLSQEVQSALTTIERHCEHEGITHRVVPRFPFKLLLNDFAKALSAPDLTDVTSVVSYLCHKIDARTHSGLSPTDLLRFLAYYPSVIIFDGLDEVPASSNRDQVLDAIREFWIDATNANADILSIASSRPQGYNEDFNPRYYQHQHLTPLTPIIGSHYAKRLADARYGSVDDRKAKVLGRLERAFEDDSTARLMRSPLQITIMTALVDRIGQPPQVLWDLFNSYYDVIYQREVERDIPASRILRDYTPDIKAIHNQVGLALQIDSERTGRTDARMSYDRFRGLVTSRLKAEGHSGEELEELTNEIVTAASERLVFLVQVEAEQIGFEIRSLQEFMAAEHLMDAMDEVVRRRLAEIAPIPSWRNVFLFAAGKCFVERQPLRDSLITICTQLNERNRNGLASACLSGADLAIALLEEGSSRRQPLYIKSLCRIAFRALDLANNRLHRRLADLYEGSLDEMFWDEIQSRRAPVDKVRVIAKWNCLLQLIKGDSPWAERLATEQWPIEPSAQLEILMSMDDPLSNPWTANKAIELLPQLGVDELVRVFREGTRQRGALRDQELDPVIDAAISVVETMHHPGPHIDMLGTGVCYGPIIRLLEKDQSNLIRLKSIRGWHPSWQVYRAGAEFLEAPSKVSLAAALNVAASVCEMATKSLPDHAWLQLPWPLAACMMRSAEARELRELARQVEAGHLGDVDDWRAAEIRWYEHGVGLDDLVCMADKALPFDSDIGVRGFPLEWRTLTAIESSDKQQDVLKELLSQFDKIPRGRVRSFVASLINWMILASALWRRADQGSSALAAESFDRLHAVYRDLPSDVPIALGAILNSVREPISGAKGFFSVIQDRRLAFDFPYGYSRETTNNALVRAYIEFDEASAMLPILAAAAEYGHLSDASIAIPKPEELRGPDERVAAVILRICQETWSTDVPRDLLDDVASVIGESNEALGRIVNALHHSRTAGGYFDEFVADLSRVVPPDDYRANSRYIRLVAEVMGRKTSQLIDAHQQDRFRLPEGVLNSLVAGREGARRHR